MKKLSLGLVLVAMLAMSSMAFAVVDYAGVADAITSEINTAIPAFVTLVGLIVGVPLAFKVVRRIAR
ncbi:MAG: hypothetical protein HZB61_10810 [Nitrospirae bacterium]|nr:hypothetical protein [Nitrospirota bacterium]